MTKQTNFKVWDGAESYILNINVSTPEAQKLSDQFRATQPTDVGTIDEFMGWLKTKGYKVSYTELGGELYINDY